MTFSGISCRKLKKYELRAFPAENSQNLWITGISCINSQYWVKIINFSGISCKKLKKIWTSSISCRKFTKFATNGHFLQKFTILSKNYDSGISCRKLKKIWTTGISCRKRHLKRVTGISCRNWVKNMDFYGFYGYFLQKLSKKYGFLWFSTGNWFFFNNFFFKKYKKIHKICELWAFPAEIHIV